MELAVTESLTDILPGCLLTVLARRAKVAMAHGCHCSVVLFFPFYRYKLYFLYMYVRSTDGQKYFIEHSFFFFK